MTQIEQSWLLELAAAGLLAESDRSRLQELLRQDARARAEGDRRQRLNLLLGQLPAAPAHDSATLSQRIMQSVRAEPTWQMTKMNGVRSEAVPDSIVDKALPAVPLHESAVFQALLREKLGQPQDRVEYLACGSAGEFLDRDESAAAAHRLATDPHARQAFRGHEQLDGLLDQWSQEADQIVASADLGALHAALAAEIASAPVNISRGQPVAEPQRSHGPRARTGFRSYGWLLGGLAAAAAVGAVWFGVRMHMPDREGSSVTVPGGSVAQVTAPKSPANIAKTPQEMQLAFAGPTLGPASLSKDAVLLVAIAPATVESARLGPMDNSLLPADDADARPRGTVTVAVDTPVRAGGGEETMVYF